ncbi:hypothetical protein B0T18DRAFT_399368 [Schizothecium vesticola]|uniref:Uncharacterized protein n=1 Tax=Schizothecium vesticola TaxID=314040 RepID=A0AA40KD62_9PEZI|nr:hypothetical protein B0T18DRAFT_399368 [Schizothecium vesticola]
MRVISSRCRHLVRLFLPVLPRPVTAPRCRACCMRRPLWPKKIYSIRTPRSSAVTGMSKRQEPGFVPSILTPCP